MNREAEENSMRNIPKIIAVFVSATAVLMTGCAKKDIIITPENTSAGEVTTVVEIVTKEEIVTREEIVTKEEIVVKDVILYTPVTEKSADITKEVTSELNSKYQDDNMQYYEVIADAVYYVGKEDSSFLEKNEGKYDRALYIGKKMYLPKYFKGTEYAVSDPEIAKIEAYMLAGDFEDWGCINTYGEYGHTFNWFYEDGYYYIADFTEATGGEEFYSNFDANLYKNLIHRFSTIDEIKKWIVEEKGNVPANYLVTMYSLMGHDYVPAFKNPAMHYMDWHEMGDGWEINYEEGLDIQILYKDSEVPVELVGVPNSELPIYLKASDYAVYGNRIIFMHDYNQLTKYLD